MLVCFSKITAKFCCIKKHVLYNVCTFISFVTRQISVYLGFRCLSYWCVEVVLTFRSTQESRSSGRVRRKENAAQYVSLAVEIRVGCLKFHAALSRGFEATSALNAAKSWKPKFLLKIGLRNLMNESLKICLYKSEPDLQLWLPRSDQNMEAPVTKTILGYDNSVNFFLFLVLTKNAN